MELSKAYNPKEVENKIYKLWEESGFFTPEKTKKGLFQKKFIVTIAPPNITGELHIGHALENILLDIIVRMKRMQGFETLWVPGIDHAAIATQNVIEKELAKRGLSRHDLGKKKFLEEFWKWKEKYGHIILEQFKKLGLSVDWSRTRFTMDENYTKAVYQVFNNYKTKGWIYQGYRVINFCPRCQSAISDLEVEYKETKGKLYFIKYPLVHDKPSFADLLSSSLASPSPKATEDRQTEYVVVATTRPETMLGDAALAVNPNDERYKSLIGKKVILPIPTRGEARQGRQDREIPIIADETVDMNFGTGAVKVTPAHSTDDFEISQRHNSKIQNPNDKIQIYEVIDKNGQMTKEAGPLCEGLNTLDCRQKVIEELERQGLLEKTEEIIHSIGHCERCGTIIELLYSKQWFLKMKDLAELAKKAVKNGLVKINPERWESDFMNWLNNIRDWNISRQIWLGHPIPDSDDVLDTWFSSALWPFAVLGWPDKNHPDYKSYYPTNLISSAREIRHLWIIRMIFSGMELTGKTPFKEVYIHPTVLTKEGQRMSKSLGTGIDPLLLIEKYGTDALRFGLAFQTTGVQDMRFNEDVIDAGRKFANKIWNASRFVLMNLEQNKDYDLKLLYPPKFWQSKNLGGRAKLDIIDKEFVKEFKGLIKSTEKNIEEFRFGQAANDLYHFFWDRFAAIYIEDAKEKLKLEVRSQKSEVMLWLLAHQLKLLHPFMPFITEEIWSKLPIKNKKMLLIEKWPHTK